MTPDEALTYLKVGRMTLDEAFTYLKDLSEGYDTHEYEEAVSVVGASWWRLKNERDNQRDTLLRLARNQNTLLMAVRKMESIHGEDDEVTRIARAAISEVEGE